MERLAIPKDDATPYPPFAARLQRQIEALDGNLAVATQSLGGSQIIRPVREEQVVLAASYASSLFQDLVHVDFLSVMRPTKKAAVSGESAASVY
jgi:hypothetical protein